MLPLKLILPQGLAAIVLAAGVLSPATPAPPGQPSHGPGGSAYIHDGIRITRLGVGAEEVHVFEPADPTPPTAPVVVFGHGWGAVDPDIYGAWIAHIVRRGSTVIYPRYQADLRTPVRHFTSHALGAVRRGLEVLGSAGHVRPHESGLVFVGHSMGGLVAANLAVRAAQGELPPPLALMAVEPGKTWPEASPIAFELDDLSLLPPAMLLVAVVGNDDDLVFEIDARRIYSGASAVPRENKSYVRLLSDDHGAPALVADHRAPTAPGVLIDGHLLPGWLRGDAVLELQFGRRGPMVVDALDYYGTWKLLDGLVDAVFHGVHREYALGNTPEQRFTGLWSDRVPVRELHVEEP
jgi:pimeloyl-ACP methyl ester carboxylesterase